MKNFFKREHIFRFLIVAVAMAIISWTVDISAAQSSGNGEELYMFYCAQCHGEKADGKGPNATEDLPTAPKNFLDPKNLPVFTDEQIVNTITKGGPAEKLSFVMPAWGNMLSDEEIDILKKYLRKTCNCQYDPEAAAKAAAEAEKK